MKTKIETVANVNNSNEAKKVSKVKSSAIPTVSKRVIELQDKIESFDKLEDDKKSQYARLLQVSRLNQVENMGLNKALKQFLRLAKEEKLNTKVLTFNNVVEYIKTSKYKNLSLFSSHQITLICNDVMKKHDKAIKLALRVERQNKAIAKK